MFVAKLLKDHDLDGATSEKVPQMIKPLTRADVASGKLSPIKLLVERRDHSFGLHTFEQEEEDQAMTKNGKYMRTFNLGLSRLHVPASGNGLKDFAHR